MPIIKYKDGNKWVETNISSLLLPDSYIKSASVRGNTLTLIEQNDTPIEFTPSGGSGGGVSGYAFMSSQTFTDEDKLHLKEAYYNNNIYMTIDYLTVIRKMSLGSKWGFVVVNTNGATSNQVLVYTVNIDGSGNITSDKFTLFMSYYLVGNTSALSGDIITSDNWSQYISVGGSSWNSTTDSSLSDLYNATDLLIKINGGNGDTSFFHGYFSDGLGNNTQSFYLLPTSHYVSEGYFQYDGSSINIYNSSNSIDTIYYKT